MTLGSEFRKGMRRLRQLDTTTPRGRFPSLAWAWPTGGRDLLLRAAILEDLPRAAAAYQQWQDNTDFDTVDFAMQRLLVAVSNRIPEGLLAAKDRARLGGVERKLWAECIIQLRTTEPALAALEKAGIDVMVFKGAVRTVLDISNLRGRYAAELDLLVRPDDFARAWATIGSAGWKYVLGFEPDLDRMIGANLSKPKSGELDLHKYPYHQVLTSDIKPDMLWARAIRARFLNHPVFIPSPTDRLLMAIAHGAIGGHEQSDWLVDCALLIRGGEVDWTLFLDLCAERDVEAYAAIVLSYLAGPLEVSVPPDALATLTRNAKGHPLRLAGALLQARPKREHSVTSAIGRGVARGIRMYRKSRMIGRLAALRAAKPGT